MDFVGREKELEELNILLKKKSASLVVIRGRRRIGKSRLIQEFTKDKKSWIFSGLPPVSTITKQRQIDSFVFQMSENLNMPKLQTSNWSELFWHLANQSKNQRLVIVFDEISWIGSKDPDFLGFLKNAWDLYFSKNPNLIFILCGSVSSWIEKNILSSTGFLGRISEDILLEELSISESCEFWGAFKNQISAYEKFKILAVTGGVPKYLEEIIFQKTAEENIQRLCFQAKGFLFREYDQIFSDLFSKRSKIYDNIVTILAEKNLTIDEICKLLKIKKSGNISKYLHDLMLAGFISKDFSWDLKKTKISNLKRFRLKDNYLRFYIRYIKPNKEKILKKIFESKSLLNLLGFESIMGLQFENLVLNHLKEVFKILKIDIQDVIMAGPFFQRRTKRQKGCQIDLLIQTRYNNLYLCEIKFCNSQIKKQIIADVQTKIDKLLLPRGYSIRPILIHVNGVVDSVLESDFFSQIIDFSDFFSKKRL